MKKRILLDFPSNVRDKISKLQLTPQCNDDTPLTKFFRDEKVKKAIHVDPNVDRWELCSDSIFFKYHKKERPIGNCSRMSII